MEKTVNELNHSLVSHKMSILRDKNTTSKEFRDIIEELTMLLTYEASRNLPLESFDVETPICKTNGKRLKGKDICLVPILRAGIGMTSGVLRLMPTCKVGHIGLYRDHDTQKPVEYYAKFPVDIAQREVWVLDPMLATGGSADTTISKLKERGITNIKFLGILAAPEGVKALVKMHPDVEIFVAKIDESLNSDAYIVPGLGDAGDRLFGTK